MVVDTLRLDEPPGDTIAEIGAVHVSPTGDLLIADRLLPRVRLYDRQGRLLAAQGRFGDGPFEYRRIAGVARDADGRIFVQEGATDRFAVLTPDLQPDTTIRDREGMGFTGLIHGFGDGIVQGSLWASAEEGIRDSLTFRSASGQRLWRVPGMPPEVLETPYWPSVARGYAASSGDRLLVANSFLYPIMVYGSEGSRVGSVGVPPPSYVRSRTLEPGELAGGGAGTPLRDWLASFTVIAGVHVVRDRWLVVSHGRLSGFPPALETRVYALDVYDLDSGRKLFDDLPVPEGSRVLGGGPYLHLLVTTPPHGWTILRLELAENRLRTES